MRVVLLDDIVNLGEAGEVVDVKNGYGRNWLIPQGLAEFATKDAVNRIELIRRAADVKRSRRLEEAADKFAALDGKELLITMKAGTESRLFGAVTSAMIADEVMIQFEIKLERRHVMLDEPIKQLGEFTVPLRAGAETTGELKLKVEPELKPGEVIESIMQRVEEIEAETGTGESSEDEGEGEAEASAATEGEVAELAEETNAETDLPEGEEHRESTPVANEQSTDDPDVESEPAT